MNMKNMVVEISIDKENEGVYIFLFITNFLLNFETTPEIVEM